MNDADSQQMTKQERVDWLKNAQRRAEYWKAESLAANAEIERLQEALAFWLPGVPGINSECADRIAHDAALLACYEGRIDDSAEKRGWILLTPEKTALKLGP